MGLLDRIRAWGNQPATKEDVWVWMFAVPVAAFFIGAMVFMWRLSA